MGKAPAREREAGLGRVASHYTIPSEVAGKERLRAGKERVVVDQMD